MLLVSCLLGNNLNKLGFFLCVNLKPNNMFKSQGVFSVVSDFRYKTTENYIN